MYFEPLTTEKAIATYHMMLFGCRTGGDEGDLSDRTSSTGDSPPIPPSSVDPTLLSPTGGAVPTFRLLLAVDRKPSSHPTPTRVHPVQYSHIQQDIWEPQLCL